MRKYLLAAALSAVAIPVTASPAMAQDYRHADRYREDHNRNGYYDRYDARQDRREYRRAERRAERRADRRYARYYDNRGYYSGPTWRGDGGRYYCRRQDGTTGLLVGGVAGAVLGSAAARDDTAGALIGGVVGALVGREIDRGGNNGRRCR